MKRVAAKAGSTGAGSTGIAAASAFALAIATLLAVVQVARAAILRAIAAIVTTSAIGSKVPIITHSRYKRTTVLLIADN